MPQFDGKKMQKYAFELWVDRWRSLAAEKGLQGQDAVWAMMEFIVNPALEKLHRRLGLRLREIEDPEEVIDELRAIYDVKYERPKLREEFEGRDQRSGETLRDYLEVLQSLHKEVDKGIKRRGHEHDSISTFLRRTPRT